MNERITINGYTSKTQKIIRLGHGNREESCWNLMKKDAFSIYYSQEEKKWLKVPRNGKYEKRISNSLLPQRAALEVAGLVSEKNNTELVSVLPEGTISLLLPHLGITIEAELKNMNKSSDRDRVVDKASELYYIAWLQAKALLLDYGWWFDDPNPGNIIRNKSGTPVLIDFSNSRFRSKPNELTQNELEGKFIKQIGKNRLRGWWD